MGLSLPAGLESLTLDNNRLGGSIPGSWRLPGNLTWLDISGNGLTGRRVLASWGLEVQKRSSLCLSSPTFLAWSWRWPRGGAPEQNALAGCGATAPHAEAPACSQHDRRPCPPVRSIPPNWELPTTLNADPAVKCLATCVGLGLHNNTLQGAAPGPSLNSSLAISLAPCVPHWVLVEPDMIVCVGQEIDVILYGPALSVDRV